VTDLVEHQRMMMAAIKDRPVATNLEAIHQLRRSRELAMLRETMLWWRELGISRCCPFTTAVLNRRGDFQIAVAAFVRETKGSSLLIEQASLFLEFVSTDSDPLVAAVANTEHALIQAKGSDEYEARITWFHEPGAVFDFLLHGTPFDEGAIKGRFVFRIECEVPGGMDWGEEGSEAFETY